MTRYKVFLCAGEPSGDFLGSQLMKALKAELNDQITFVGLGGPLMVAEGITSLFSIEELSIMGLAEVIPHIWKIRRRIHETVEAIEKLRPNIVVTIDSPGFNFRVGKALKKRGSLIPLVHYVAPSVWAWRQGRTRKVAKFLDHLLTLFPFEPSYFLKEGLKTHFVGHPVVELGLDKMKDSTFRKRYSVPKTAPILTLLPGSRRGEITRLLPIFQETVVRLQKKYSNLQIIIPTLPHLEKQIREHFTLPATLLTTQKDKYAAFAQSQAALAASGTVSLELAAAGVPMVIAYKINALTHSIIRRMVKVKYACLVNILLNKPVVPELLQQDCTSEKLASALDRVFEEKNSERKGDLSQMKRALKMLNAPKPFTSPSQCAARHVCQIMGY